MYSKEETSKLKQDFWTTFGRYMKPILSADGEKVSWANYKTGIPGIFFKMDTDNRHARISILITQADPTLHAAFYELFEMQKQMLETTLGENDWAWEQNTTDDYGQPISRITKELKGISVLRNEDWPTLISFFKERMVALDEYWSMAKYGFEALV
ncbi:uncharacterized protein DUF4268 [Chitinophaga skermanii]|uniref:Uncharacterized protein DUF4268 n=1 Tax=Chitinophaga skermanii TaxID=331697 RepID=A0A327Q040_9BACT|nr:DUF4268 domain-containing protein [Chitinophaga skermanii]RAI97699.1 uncharacterized protein DUF4268 [Chitinophaga skermanii]